MQHPFSSRFHRSLVQASTLALAIWAGGALAQSSSSGSSTSAESSPPPAQGPIYLRQPQSQLLLDRRQQRGSTGTPAATGTSTPPQPILPSRQEVVAPDNPYDQKPGEERTLPWQRQRTSEFERYIQKLTNGFEVKRLGSELVTDPGNEPDPLDASPLVPGDYVIVPGDELLLSMWGTVEADLRLKVDRGGRIQVPRVGQVQVAGVKYQDLAATIDKAARRVFKNFELNVSLTQLRGVRVFVTGFAEMPGAYNVSSLTSVSSVLFRAGGPAAAGSFRNIEIRRGGKVVARLDLYDLVVHGKRDADLPVQASDVIHVGPVGREVAVIGSVNRQAIVELKPGETVADALQMVGGFNSVADRSRLAIERLGERADRRVQQLAWPADQGQALDAGDVLRVFSALASSQPQFRQNRRVLIEGEVARPGEYILPANSSMADLVRMAGGYTEKAFLFGTEFTRESVRLTQVANYERMLRDLEVEVSRATNANGGKAPTDTSISVNLLGDRLIQRLRDVKPNGRVVLQLPLDAKVLPDLVLEDGDRIRIPPQPTSIGVFGSVFNSGNYLFMEQRSIGDYLRLAGDPTRQADDSGVYVLRANGNVESARQRSNWLSSGVSSLAALPALPGDTIFVPDELNKPPTAQNLKDWAQIVYQFVLGAAAVKSLND